MGKHWYSTKFLWIIFLLIGKVTLAQANGVLPGDIDLKSANEQLSHVSSQLATGKLDSASLFENVEGIKALQEKSKVCIEEGSKQLASINDLLKATEIIGRSDEESENYRYLKDKKQRYAKHIAGCKLFIFRSQETLNEFKSNIQTLTSSKTLKKTTPIWKVMDSQVIENFKVDTSSFLKSLGINHFGPRSLTVLGLLLLTGIIFYFALRKKLASLLSGRESPTSIATHSLMTLKIFSPYIITTLIISGYISIMFAGEDPTPSLMPISHIALGYVLAIMLSYFTLNLPPANMTENWLPILQKKIFLSIFWVLTLMFIRYELIFLLDTQPFTSEQIDIARTLYITIFTSTVLWVTWHIFHLPFFQNKKQFLSTRIAKLIVISFFLSIILLEWMGHHNLSVFLIRSVVLSLLMILILLVSFHFIGKILYRLEDYRFKVSQKLHYYMGVKSHKTLYEITIIKISLYLIILALSIITFMEIWGVSLITIDSIKTGLIEGITLLNIHIAPLKLVMGFMVFAISNILGKLLCAYVAHRSNVEHEKETQVAFASILHYITFTVSVLIAMLVAGVNFTGIAIIAGALSVGAGFGLQNIVNNFICGVILLMQKPVKPGDRVVVDETEGFIRKIRILSTQITTMSKEDVIIPNSYLISNPITNYMFRDRLWRVICTVGVAYGSDVDLVKQLLLNVAAQHPEVLQETSNKPAVLFRSFGDNSLIFELWSIIRDVNKKFHIESDLNFAIDRTFREHGVVIAFPQLDLHVKEVKPKPQ